MEALTSVEKAVDVLFALHGAEASVGVTDLGRSLGLPKSSAHRLLAALCRRGLVERDDRGRYQPGLALVALGLGTLEREPLVAVARQTLELEAEDLGETVFLVAARAGRLRVLDKAEGTGFLRAAPRVGESVPIHATGAGRIFLAFAPGLVTLPAGPLQRFTERTPATRRALDAAVEEVRRRGYAENRDEWIPGLSVVSAPIFTRGELRGAVAVAAPSARMEELGREPVARRARAAAARIGERLAGATPRESSR
jgi:IclR family transcriptional regulator, acetate operon repressor